MPSIPKILAGGDGATTLGTTEAELLAPPSGHFWTGVELVLYNTHSSAVTVTLSARRTGASTSTVVDVVVLPAGGRSVHRIPCLGVGDQLRAKDSQGAVVHATAFGAESS